MGGPEFDFREGDPALVSALRAGDDAAFAWLLDRYDSSLRRTALMYVPSRAVADEVVQETWLGVIKASTGSRADRRSRRGSSGS